MKAIKLAEKFTRFEEAWSPRIVADLNENHVKVARLLGEFVWHRHEGEDEMFLVLKGTLRIELRDGEILLREGEMAVVPRGVEHRPVAAEEVHVLLVEPKSTVNTGDAGGERTVVPEWI